MLPAATVGDKVTLTATSTVDATKKDTVILTVGAPDLTGFTLAAAPVALTDSNTKLALTGTANTVVTVTPVPAKAVLGAVTAPSSDATKATSAVGTGANSNKVTITGVAAGTTNVEISVAGVTAKQTIAVTVS